MRYKTIFYFCTILLFLILLPKMSAAEVAIGAVVPKTGGGAEYGKVFLNGLRLAVEHINTNINFEGKPIILYEVDSESKPEVAVRAVNQMIDNVKNIAAIYTLFSGESLACAPITSDAQILQITTEAKNCKLTTSNFKNILRFIELDVTRYGAVLNYYILNSNARKVTIVAPNGYNIDDIESIIEMDKPRDYTITSPSSVGEAIINLTAADTFLLFDPCNTEKIKKEIFDKILNSNKTMITISQEICDSDQIREIYKPRGELFVETEFDLTINKLSEKFDHEYFDKYQNHPRGISARAYCSMMYLMNIIISTDGNLKDIVNKFRDIGEIELPIGKVTVLPNGDISKENIIQKWKSGSFTTVLYRGPKPKPHPKKK